jgi:simple sugar transport system permease protein
LTVIISMLFGAIWSGIAGYLKAKLNISEIYVTVMMNYVMLYFSSYLLEVVWRTPEKESWSEMIGNNSKWPALLTGTPLHIGFIFAGLVFILVIFLNRTPLGFEIKAAGQNSLALQFKLKNRDYNFIIMFVMILSGALAGLAGAAQLCGNQYRFSLQLNQNFGFTGIVAARLGGMNPVGILVTSLLFGILSSGSTTMQVVTGVPASIADVLQGMLFVTAILADRIAMYKIVKIERGVAA